MDVVGRLTSLLLQIGYFQVRTVNFFGPCITHGVIPDASMKRATAWAGKRSDPQLMIAWRLGCPWKIMEVSNYS